jgi:hypothetical protein
MFGSHSENVKEVVNESMIINTRKGVTANYDAAWTDLEH